MTAPTTRVPTTVVTGALGVGKTSALLHLAQHQPPGERWVVLVNEFGEVGIDGALLADGGLAVRELPGGCLCCAGQAPMEVTLRQLLTTLSPTRILIEPSGVADASSVLDTLATQFAEHIDLRAVITLVDPRALQAPRGRHRSAWQAQVDAADVLVGNRVDVCTPAELRAFLEWTDALWPPKLAVVTTQDGALDPALLDARPLRRETAAGRGQGHGHSHPAPSHAQQALAAPVWVDHTGTLPDDLARRLFRRVWAGPDFTTCGWVFPPEIRFENVPLNAVLEGLVAVGALRVKGVFHTAGGWRAVQADRDGTRSRATSWRSDSRLEVIAPPPGPDWVSVDEALAACVLPA